MAREHPPALGADAARPACYDTIHVRVVSVVPRAAFGADLGKKEKQEQDPVMPAGGMTYLQIR